jgi:uncharacterized protein (TIGR02246 family)
MDAFAELFAVDTEFLNVVGLWWKGRPAIKGAHEFTHQTMFRNSRLNIHGVKARFPMPGFAIARCRWKLADHLAPDGAAYPARMGILVYTLQQAGGARRIIDSQNTDFVDRVVSRPQ